MQCCHLWYHQCHLTLAPMVSHNKKLCYTSFWSPWPKECSCAIGNAIGILWCQWHQMTKKVMLHLSFIVLTKECTDFIDDVIGISWDLHIGYLFFQPTKRVMLDLISVNLTQGIKWCHWWWCWQHVMPMPAPLVSHDQKSHVAPHFNCLNLRNVMVSTTSVLASYGTTNGDSDQKVMLHLIMIVNNLRNAWLQLMTWQASCDSDINTSSITWPKSHVASQLHSMLS